MITPELRQYLTEALTQGVAPAQVGDALRTGGWQEEDIALALGEYAQMMTPPPAVAQSGGQETALPEPTGSITPTLPGATVFASEDMPPDTTSAPPEPIAGAFAPQTAGATPGEVYPEEANAVATEMPGHRSVLPRIVIGVATLSFLVGGGALAYVFMKGPSPSDAYARMPGVMKEITSVAFESSFSLKGDVTAQNDGYGSPETVDLDATITLSGATVVRPETLAEYAFDGVLDVKGDVRGDGESMGGELEIAIKVVNKKLYLSLLRYPDMAGYLDALDGVKGKWIEFPLEDLEKAAKEEGDRPPSMYDSVLPPGIPGDDILDDVRSSSTEAALKRYADTILAYPPLEMTLSEKAPGTDPLEYHYVIVVVEKNLLRALEKLGEATWKWQEDRMRSASKSSVSSSLLDTERERAKFMRDWEEMTDLLVPIFSRLTTELWVEQESAYLRRATMNLPIATTTEYGTVNMGARYDLKLSKFNEPVVVGAPKDALTLEKASELLFGVTRGNTRDAVRRSDTMNIRLGLELYFDAHQSYPLSIDELLGAYIPGRIPSDPLDGSPYPYVPIGKDGKRCTKMPCPKFLLGASFEDAGSEALKNDADAVFPEAAFFGSDLAGCDGAIGRSCFDMTQ